jgi:hypothetical protein
VPIQSVFRNFNFWDSAGALEKLSIRNVVSYLAVAQRVATQ